MSEKLHILSLSLKSPLTDTDPLTVIFKVRVAKANFSEDVQAQ